MKQWLTDRSRGHSNFEPRLSLETSFLTANVLIASSTRVAPSLANTSTRVNQVELASSAPWCWQLGTKPAQKCLSCTAKLTLGDLQRTTCYGCTACYSCRHFSFTQIKDLLSSMYWRLNSLKCMSSFHQLSQGLLPSCHSTLFCSSKYNRIIISQSLVYYESVIPPIWSWFWLLV